MKPTRGKAVLSLLVWFSSLVFSWWWRKPGELFSAPGLSLALAGVLLVSSLFLVARLESYRGSHLEGPARVTAYLFGASWAFLSIVSSWDFFHHGQSVSSLAELSFLLSVLFLILLPLPVVNLWIGPIAPEDLRPHWKPLTRTLFALGGGLLALLIHLYFPLLWRLVPLLVVGILGLRLYWNVQSSRADRAEHPAD